MEKQENQIKKCIVLIDKLKLYISLIITRKLRGFDPRYNLKQKYKVSIPSYNIKNRILQEKS